MALRRMVLRDFVIVQELELELHAGYTALTGETGAGKTMVLTALNLILGGKSDSDFVRSGEERLAVSGRFEIGSAIALKVEDAGGYVEDSEVIINRYVTNQ